MKFLDIFKKKEQELPPIPEDINVNQPLPQDLEQFKVPKEPVRPPGYPEAPKEPVKPAGYPEPAKPYEGSRAPYGGPVPELGAPPKLPEEAPPEPVPIGGDKVDLILQKLDTIDTRLKLLEERTK